MNTIGYNYFFINSRPKLSLRSNHFKSNLNALVELKLSQIVERRFSSPFYECISTHTCVGCLTGCFLHVSTVSKNQKMSQHLKCARTLSFSLTHTHTHTLHIHTNAHNRHAQNHSHTRTQNSHSLPPQKVAKKWFCWSH